MATIDGARALHMEKEIGSLEPGKKADLILVSLNEPNAVPMYDIYAQIAYSLKGSDVETVVIGGRVVMRERKLLTVDEARVLEKAREYRKSVSSSLGMESIRSGNSVSPPEATSQDDAGAPVDSGVGFTLIPTPTAPLRQMHMAR